MAYPTKKIAFLGLMLALVLVLALAEQMMPPLPMVPPSFGRIGLSNAVIMYVVVFIGSKEALTLAVLKALFNMLMRGPMAGSLSLTGGLLSVFLMLILWWIFKDKISYIALSIAGAIGHNIGQLMAACLILQNWLLFIAYFPVLLITGAIFGTVTGVFLKIIMPAFNGIYRC